VPLPADPNWPTIELRSPVTIEAMAGSGRPLYVKVVHRATQDDSTGLVWVLDREKGIARPVCRAGLALRSDAEECNLYIQSRDVDGDGWLDLDLVGRPNPTRDRSKWLGDISRVLLYDPVSSSLRFSSERDKGLTPARKTEVHLTPPAGKAP